MPETQVLIHRALFWLAEHGRHAAPCVEANGVRGRPWVCCCGLHELIADLHQADQKHRSTKEQP